MGKPNTTAEELIARVLDAAREAAEGQNVLTVTLTHIDNARELVRDHNQSCQKCKAPTGKALKLLDQLDARLVSAAAHDAGDALRELGIVLADRKNTMSREVKIIATRAVCSCVLRAAHTICTFEAARHNPEPDFELLDAIRDKLASHADAVAALQATKH